MFLFENSAMSKKENKSLSNHMSIKGMSARFAKVQNDSNANNSELKDKKTHTLTYSYELRSDGVTNIDKMNAVA